MAAARGHGRARAHRARFRRVVGDVRLRRLPIFGRDSALPARRGKRGDRSIRSVIGAAHLRSPDQRPALPTCRVTFAQAFVATEDRRFYEHNGLDWRAVCARSVATLTAMGVREGFSTITMQVARNTFIVAHHRSERSLRTQADRAALRAPHRAATSRRRRFSSCTSTSSISATERTGWRRRAAICSARA